MCGRRNDVFLKPHISILIAEAHAALLYRLLKTEESSNRGSKVARLLKFVIGSHEQGDTLPLSETGIPRSF